MKIHKFAASVQNFLLKPSTLVILSVISAAAAGGSYFYAISQGKMMAKTNSPQASVDETKALLNKVSKLVVLPEGEDPTVATVTDIDKLKDQAFFIKAKNGDKVLIYTRAKKAYLYDPQINKILDIAPVNIGTGAGQVSGQAIEKKSTPTPTKAQRR